MIKSLFFKKPLAFKIPESKLIEHQRLWIDDSTALTHLNRLKPDPETAICLRELIEDGITVVRSGLTPKICEAAIQDYNKWCSKNAKNDRAYKIDQNGHNNRLVNFHLASDSSLKLFTSNEKALKVLDMAFGGLKSSIYTSLFFQVGTQQPIHRDTPVFRTAPEMWYFGYWTALEDVNEQNGPLMVIKKGHRLNSTPPWEIVKRLYEDFDLVTEQMAQEKLWPEFQDELYRQCLTEGLKVETIELKKGDSIIWHPELPHGGSVVLDPKRTRHSMVYHVVPEGVPVYQAKVFFDKNANPTLRSDWHYLSKNNRIYVDFGNPSFM